jgi:hypothetical protein
MTADLPTYSQPRGGRVPSSSNNREISAPAATWKSRVGHRRSSTTTSIPSKRDRSLRKVSRTRRLARLRSTARGATRLLAMMPIRAWDRPLGLTNRAKWRRVLTAPVASAPVNCSRCSNRALRGSVALALRRSAARALWRVGRATPHAHREYACARESRGCACGGFLKAGKYVSSCPSAC